MNTATAIKPSETTTEKPLATIERLDENAMKSLVAEVIQLRAQVAANPAPVKKPVETPALKKAIAQLVSEANEDLKSANPRALPNLSLSGILEFIPDMTDEQRKMWNPVRDDLRKHYSAKHRELLAKRRAIFARVSKDPKAMISTVARQRKDGSFARVSLSASQKSKGKAPTGRGKNAARPKQIAAKVPAAGNAAKPATL